MPRPWISARTRRHAALLVLLALPACSSRGGGGPAVAPPSDLLAPGLTIEERLARVEAAGKPGNLAALPALLRLMKDRSQCAFLLENDPGGPFGYRAVELQDTGPDEAPLLRAAAIASLEAIGSAVPLVDLSLALSDRHPVVANHAARALVRLGSRAGLDVLLAHLEGVRWPRRTRLPSPAFAGETADRILRSLTGRDAGYSADAGHLRKLEALARWREILDARAARGEPLDGERRPYQAGQDSEADRRIAFHVDMLGQMQTLYHEQVRDALARLGAVVLPFLRDAVEDGLARRRETLLGGAAQVLASIPGPNAQELLATILRSAPPAARSRAAGAFGTRGGTDAVRLLAALETDSDPGVRGAAISALGRIRSPEALAALDVWRPGSGGEEPVLHQLALFEASGGRRHQEACLQLLVEGSVARRNRAVEELPEREAARDRYRELLPRP
jgi:HEAT repeat protein